MLRSLAIVCSIGIASTAAAGDPGLEPFTSYYAFGDSLSDDGKFGTLAPPSDDGRFSSGPVWVEYIAEVFERAGLETRNYALGGATAGDNARDYAASVPLSIPEPFRSGQIAFLEDRSTFDRQIDVMLPPSGSSDPAQAENIGDNPLVSVLFGANDIFQQLPGVLTGALTSLDPSVVAANIENGLDQLAHDSASAIADGINKINGIDAAFDDFFVVGLPDIGESPAFSEWGIFAARVGVQTATTPEERAEAEANLAFLEANQQFDLASRVSSKFNDALSIALTDLNQGVHATLFDLDEFFSSFSRTVADGGVNITDPCTPSFGANTGIVCQNDPDSLSPGILELTRGESFFFSDSVHPSGFVHREFANRALARLSDNLPEPSPVPLPAGLPMALFAFGTLGWVARRKAKQAA